MFRSHGIACDFVLLSQVCTWQNPVHPAAGKYYGTQKLIAPTHVGCRRLPTLRGGAGVLSTNNHLFQLIKQPRFCIIALLYVRNCRRCRHLCHCHHGCSAILPTAASAIVLNDVSEPSETCSACLGLTAARVMSLVGKRDSTYARLLPTTSYLAGNSSSWLRLCGAAPWHRFKYVFSRKGL